MPAPSTYNETLLLQQISAGDAGAFRTLYDLYRDKIYFFIFRLTESSETAEDVLQEVFIKLWIQRADLPAIDNINAWIYRLAHNQALNGLKRLATEVRVNKEWSDSHPASPASDEQLIKHDTEKLLGQAVQQLPPQQKLIYQLSREQGLKYEEIATQLNISPLTVKKHMAQALKFLRKHLDQQHHIGPDLAGALVIVFRLLQ